MLGINTNNYFYSYVVDIINTKLHKSKQITPKKAYQHILDHLDITKALPEN